MNILSEEVLKTLEWPDIIPISTKTTNFILGDDGESFEREALLERKYPGLFLNPQRGRCFPLFIFVKT